jgi:hephaestin
LIAATLTMTAAHLPVTGEHFRQAPYIGALFVVLEIAGLVLAGLLIFRDSRWVYALTAVTGGSAIAAYVVSRSLGLPQIRDDVGNWAEPLGVVSLVAESVMAVGGVVVVAGLGMATLLVPMRAAAPASAALLIIGLGATVAAAANAGPAHAHAASSPMAMTGSGYWHDVGGTASRHGVTRTYYISSDPVVWDYAPTGKNQITGKPFDSVADTFVASGPGQIGSRYVKCLYREYTDASFGHVQPRPASEDYQGIYGPVMHAAVGDTIKVVFRNTCPFPTAVHPHGVFYKKSSEGGLYNDGTSAADKADDAVPNGGRHTYLWKVPERAGPGPHDGSSVMWMYHSHTDEIADTYAGLMGPMVVTRAGWARGDGTPKDVDREVFAQFFIDNETLSPLFAENLRRFGTPPMPSPDAELSDDFVETNLKHSVNGYLYGNMPMITMHKGERVRWYVMSMGTEVDLHTPHWHGNDVLVGGMRMDVVSLLPAGMIVADMVPDNVGTWLFHCHVNDHIDAGMQARYQVVP